MKIFVTGGTGFIGRFVVEKLKIERHKILILTRCKDLSESGGVSYLQGNLANMSKWKKDLKKFDPQIVIHLAWERIPDYSIENSLKNLKHSIDLIKMLTETSCQKILVAGSLWEYGTQKGKISEENCLGSLNGFTAAKNSLYFIGKQIAEDNDINLIWTRIFYVYGPGQKKDSLIPSFIDKIKQQKKPEIRNPLAQNDFIYVEDVAEAVVKLVTRSKKGGAYNVGSGKLTSVQTIIEKVFKSLGGNKLLSREIKAEYELKKREQTDSFNFAYADISKIKREIGWKPTTNIDSGIEKTVRESFFNSFL